jgi:hypothetical protein
MATTEEVFRDALALRPEVRAELTERLIASLAEDISPEITSGQLAEVRGRIAQVGSGEVALVPGDEAATIIEVEKLALNLSEQERATLDANLLPSLPVVLSDEDEGVAEALRRDAEMDGNPDEVISLAQLDSILQNRRG